MNPQVVIPMSGLGRRFLKAGFATPKPLIEIFGKPMFQWAREMYPADWETIFVVNTEHLSDKKLNMREKLLKVDPNAVIVELEPHSFGPGFAVNAATAAIKDYAPVIINYCDFAGTFNSDQGLRDLIKYDSWVLTYSGFNPHMLRSNKFAYVKKNTSGEVIDIQEKQPFTNDPNSEETSAGAYGFKSGSILKSALKFQLDNPTIYSLGGEFYTSLTVKAALDLSFSVGTTLMDKFFQWGTPEDLSDFIYWNNSVHEIFSNINVKKSEHPSNVLILACGRGERIRSVANEDKILIPVGKKQLWEHAADSSDAGTTKCLLVRSELKERIQDRTDVRALTLDIETNGQADSALIGIEEFNIDNDLPLTILSSDSVVPKNFNNLATQRLAESGADLVVWTSYQYPPALFEGEHFSWVKSSNYQVTDLLSKNTPKVDVDEWSIIIGNFTFKSGILARNEIRKLLSSDNLKINGEFYLDTLVKSFIESKMKVISVEVPNYFSLGTESEFLSYKYWEECSTFFSDSQKI